MDPQCGEMRDVQTNALQITAEEIVAGGGVLRPVRSARGVIGRVAISEAFRKNLVKNGVMNPRRANHSLTPEKAMDSMNCRCPSRKAMIVGRVAVTVPAIKSVQFVP